MSNKTLKDEKAKTASALSSHFLSFVSALAVLVFAAGIVALAVLRPKPPLASGNCQDWISKSQLFHCNISELEYAVEPGQRTMGLSGRERLEDNQGMVFVFEAPMGQCMWMKDMKFSLDIVWLDEKGKIIKLLKDVSPATYPERFCANNARFVLEVNSGTMDKLGIGVGDSIRL